VLYAAEENRPALTDERILQIAERHRNHTLTAQSGTKFDVIEHAGLVAFAREIERAVIRQQTISAPKSPVIRWDTSDDGWYYAYVDDVVFASVCFSLDADGRECAEIFWEQTADDVEMLSDPDDYRAVVERRVAEMKGAAA
jgi:hypothetical protein